MALVPGTGEHLLAPYADLYPAGDPGHLVLWGGFTPVLAITLLLCHMYLETKTTELVDSLEVASIKFLNTVVERRAQAPRPVAFCAVVAVELPKPSALIS